MGLIARHLKSFSAGLRTLGSDLGLPFLGQITTICHRSARRFTWHTHQGCELIFVLDGALEVECCQHPISEVRGGSFLVVPSGMRHRAVNDLATPSTRCGLVVNPKSRNANGTLLTGQDLQNIANRLMRLGVLTCPIGPKTRLILNQLMEAHQAYEANRDDWLLKLDLRLWCCASILAAIRDIGLSQESSRNVLVTAGEKYLQQHLDESVHMPDLARHIGLGRTRLRDLFRSVTGLTPHHYLLRLRIQKAKKLLVESDVGLGEIAMGCGFSSSQHLSSVFHKYTGHTPRQYRKLAPSPSSPPPSLRAR